MNILIRNATIVPMTTEDAVSTGSIAIEDRHIHAIGSVPSTFVPDRVIEASGKIALPGMVNAHTHVSMTYFRNYRDAAADLHTWLQQIWRLEALLRPEDTYVATQLGIAEMIRSGTTCFSDMYFFPEGTARAVIESNMKAQIGLTLFGDEEDSKRRIDERLPYLRDLLRKSAGKITFDIAPHAVYTCTPGTYRIAVETAAAENCRVHTHASETTREVVECIQSFQKTPIAHLADLGVLAGRSYVAHAVHPHPEDIALLADNQVPVIHNPSSNCKLGSGIAPITAYRDAGVPLALGTDGPSSNNALDMFQEMRLAAMLASGSTGNPLSLTPYEIIRMATIGGALALGRQDECGTLEIGKDADIILIDKSKPHMTPLNNLYSALVFSAKSSDVDTVICAGNILMEQRELKTLDLESIRDRFLGTWVDIQERDK